MTLTDRQLRLLRGNDHDSQLFREGAEREAQARRDDVPIVHRELLQYVRALAEAHPDWSSSRIAESMVRVFQADENAARVSIAARIELEDMSESSIGGNDA